ncbi:helix-turn-helix transcriptional regulator [Brochothrix thermosphacta]|uniref:Putative transcriptional regulator, DeoR family n=1 Tax=Brochothrix thermosphacta TaxID=2756 RepID=A0A2X0S373_BROTH|nr:YafY family protein [Brochothrix thermosphacta]SPP28827.1 putative transcriptional regulator, DeoR family [Brochothrix thermosphacta]
MKISRLISIIMILLDKERVSAHELANIFEVSKRTIYRDIDAINLAGIPVYSTSGVGGGFEIMKRYKIDQKTFSSTDISSILIGLSGFSKIIKSAELTNALTKVKSFIPADKVNEIEFQTNQIQIDLNQWISDGNVEKNLNIIKLALQNYNILSFEYTSAHGIKTERKTEPYQIILKSNHWYFHGYCYTRKDFRLFKLSRVSKLKIENSFFKPKDYQKPLLDFTDTWTSIQIRTTIRIHKSIMDRVLDFCVYEDFTSDGEEHYIVDFPLIENDYYYNIILSFGDKCQFLEPLHIRTELKNRIQNIANLYKD